MVHRVIMIETCCTICDYREESGIHIFLDYPFAAQVWEASRFDRKICVGSFRSMQGCIELVMSILEQESLCYSLRILVGLEFFYFF